MPETSVRLIVSVGVHEIRIILCAVLMLELYTRMLHVKKPLVCLESRSKATEI